MLSRFIPVLAGAAMAATVGPAFAFDAIVSAPKALHTHPWHHAAVIGVIPANAVIDIAHCNRGWCEAAYAGQLGYVYTPVLVSGAPVAPAYYGPVEVVTAPVAWFGGVFAPPAPAPAPVPEPVVARY